MTISEELRVKISERLDAIVEFKKPGMSYANHCKEFGRLMAQAEIDKEDLVDVGLDWEEKEIGDAIQPMLMDEHSERINAEGEKSEDEKLLDEKITAFDKAKVILFKVSGYIEKRTPNESFHASLKIIKKSESTIDLLDIVVQLVDLVSTEQELALQIKPAKTAVTAEYLATLKSDILSCAELQSRVQVSSSLSAIHVENQRRLITLSMEIEDIIIEFADSAFAFDRAYFKEHYVNHVRRAQYRARLRAQEAETIEEE